MDNMDNIDNIDNKTIEWNDLSILEEKYKKMIKNYFPNYSGKYYIQNNELVINYDNWGIEKFYINQNTKKFYKVKYENINIDNISEIAVFIQIGNWDKFEKMEPFLQNFENIHCTFYFVMTIDNYNYYRLKYLQKKYINSVIIYSINKGMDIGLFLINLHYTKTKNIKHKYIFKIHTKTDDNFRNITLNNLMGNENKIYENLERLKKKNIGMVGVNNKLNYNDNNHFYIKNMFYINKYVNFLYTNDPEVDKLEFIEGTMFVFKEQIFDILNFYNIEYIYDHLNDEKSFDRNWYSVYYNLDVNNIELLYKHYCTNIKNKFSNNLNYQTVEKKSGLRDYMIEHAFERLFGYFCRKCNLLIDSM